LGLINILCIYIKRVNSKTGKIVLYVPMGVNVNDLVKLHCDSVSVKDQKWFKETKGFGSRYDSIKVNNLPKVLLFITLLLYLRCVGWDSGKGSEEAPDRRMRWLYLGQDFLRGFIDKNDIPRVVSILRAIGIIETKPHLANDYVRGYRFTSAYENLKPIPFKFEYQFPPSKTENWKSNWSRRPQGEFEKQLCKNVEEFAILSEVRDYVLSKDFEDTLDEGDSLELSRSAALTSIDFIESFEGSEERHVVFKRDKNVNRVYTNITGLKRELRRFLRHGDQRVVELDMNGSHPLFLLRLYRQPHLLNDPVAQKEMKKYTHLWDEGDFYASIIEELGFVPDKKKNQSFESLRGDVKQAFFSGFLYVKRPCGDIGEKLEDFYSREFPILHREMTLRRTNAFLPSDDPYWRRGDRLKDMSVKLLKLDDESQIPIEGDCDVVVAEIAGKLFIKVFGHQSKEMFFKGEQKFRGKKHLFAKLRKGLEPLWSAGGVPEDLLGEVMPILGEITGLTRLNGQLAVENMRVESAAIIDGVAKENFESENFWLATIHDSIVVDPENALKARALMEKHLNEKLGFVHELKVKWLGEKQELSESELKQYSLAVEGSEALSG
jgi:hypothetical protein